jgi:siroheme synthase (precorrin-2 oxidase/ferrochelatase)
MGVVGLGQGVVGHVRVEVLAALAADVLRVSEFDVAGPTVNQIAHVMQQTGARPVSKARLAAQRTREMWIVATASNDPPLW